MGEGAGDNLEGQMGADPRVDPMGATPIGVPRPMEVCTGGAQSISQTCQLCKSKVLLQSCLMGIPPVWGWGEGKGDQRITVAAAPCICRTRSEHGRVVRPLLVLP